jgi:hypothetical protein
MSAVPAPSGHPLRGLAGIVGAQGLDLALQGGLAQRIEEALDPFNRPGRHRPAMPRPKWPAATCHSLQAHLERRFAPGFTWTAS